MPPNTKKRTNTSEPRSRFLPGKNAAQQGRPGDRGNSAKAPRIIANSIFALTLKDRPGIEVEKCKADKPMRRDGEIDDYGKMYRDLRKCLLRAMQLLGKPTKYDPLGDGLSIGVSLWSIINCFKENVKPKGFEVNISRDDHTGYYFTIYKGCEFPDYWHAMEISPIVRVLAKENPKLHDVFLRFISYFGQRLNIGFWYNGGLWYSEYIIDEHIELFEDNNGPVEADDDATTEQKEEAGNNAAALFGVIDDNFSYTTGEAKLYEDYMRHCDTNPDKIRAELSRFPNQNPLVRFMHEAIVFCQEPGSLDHYCSAELDQEEGVEGLPFDRQVNIIWDWDDHITALEMESIESEANNFGVIPPVFLFSITSHTKKLDFSDFHTRLTWPKRLHCLWAKYRDLVMSYKNKLIKIK